MSQTLNAVLVRLSVSQFNNSREDDSITKEVKALHKLAGKAGKWVKIKLPDEALEDIRSAVGKARTEHYRITLPWEDGNRLLPLTARTAYEASQAVHRDTFNQLVAKFIGEYPQWIAKAREMHNGTFNEGDYPPEDILRTQFTYRNEYSPVPAASHFVSSITGPALEQMRQQLEQSNQRRVEQAIADVWNRLLEPVRKLSEKLTEKDPIFRDTLVSNVRDILALVPTLNVVGNAQLTAAAQQIQSTLGSLDADLLRTNKVVRRLAAEGATEIVRKFGALGARKFAN
jgi:hypothetical protein